MAESHWKRLLKRVSPKAEAAPEKPKPTKEQSLLKKLKPSRPLTALEQANIDIIKGMGVPADYIMKSALEGGNLHLDVPPTTIPFGDDYVDDGNWAQEYLNNPPPTTVPDEYWAPPRHWDNQTEIAKAKRRGERYCLVYRWDLGQWCPVDVEKKPGEIHTVPCPIAGGSWAGVERAVVETVIEQMNHEEQLRRVRMTKQAEADRKAAEEKKRLDLGKPMQIKRPWHKDRRDTP